MTRTIPKLAFALALSAAALLGVARSEAAKPGGGSGCPNSGIICYDLWDPVICSDGHVYSNSCYALRACATGCVPYGDVGPVIVE